jgi:hypothetical protein
MLECQPCDLAAVMPEEWRLGRHHGLGMALGEGVECPCEIFRAAASIT